MKKTTTLCAIIIALAINARAEYTDDCITFSCATSFWLHTSSPGWDGTLWVSTDKTNWREWDGNRCDSERSGDRHVIYVRGDSANTKITGKAESAWRLLGNRDSIACSGNIETLRGAKGMAPSPTPMAERCYAHMFSLNGSMIEAPALCATNLASRCYESMFFYCTSLTNAPALPATTLADECYIRMFTKCAKLMQTPALAATALATGCYEDMFSGCTALTSAPALPATELAPGCYAFMFSGCTSLTDVPMLPALNLAERCYMGMFDGCRALAVNATAPGKEWEIPAETRAPLWCCSMFLGTAGTLQGEPELNTTYYIASAHKEVDCITFSSEGAFTLKTCNLDKNWDGTLWTSTDQLNWNVWYGEEVSAEQMGGAGPYNLYVRGKENTVITGGGREKNWVLTPIGKNTIACSGNIETLRGAKGDAPSSTPMAAYCYSSMLCNVPLTSAPALTATNLSVDCYSCMFFYCTALTDAPELPAMALADSCYATMFASCTSLTNPPALPAMTLADSCYAAMFFDCKALTDAPALPAMTLADSCYAGMFLDCSSLKSLPELPATNLMHHCYHEMFSECTSLEVNIAAPGQEWKISATTAAPEWGTDMFSKTAGSLKGQPETNATYYVKSAPEPVHKTSLVTPTPKE